MFVFIVIVFSDSKLKGLSGFEPNEWGDSFSSSFKIILDAVAVILQSPFLRYAYILFFELTLLFAVTWSKYKITYPEFEVTLICFLIPYVFEFSIFPKIIWPEFETTSRLTSTSLTLTFAEFVLMFEVKREFVIFAMLTSPFVVMFAFPLISSLIKTEVFVLILSKSVFIVPIKSEPIILFAWKSHELDSWEKTMFPVSSPA